MNNPPRSPSNPPDDGPLISIEEAARYVRMSTAAFCKLLGGRMDGDDGELGRVARECLVTLSPRRRLIAREKFLGWLNERTKLSGTDA